MRVRRYTRDPRHPEVERRHLVAGLLHEHDEEAAQARVHVHRDAVTGGHGGQGSDGVHDAVGVLGGRAHELAKGNCGIKYRIMNTQYEL